MEVSMLIYQPDCTILEKHVKGGGGGGESVYLKAFMSY